MNTVHEEPLQRFDSPWAYGESLWPAGLTCKQPGYWDYFSSRRSIQFQRDEFNDLRLVICWYQTINIITSKLKVRTYCTSTSLNVLFFSFAECVSQVLLSTCQFSWSVSLLIFFFSKKRSLSFLFKYFVRVGSWNLVDDEKKCNIHHALVANSNPLIIQKQFKCLANWKRSEVDHQSDGRCN